MRKSFFFLLFLSLVFWTACGKESSGGDSRAKFAGQYELRQTGFIYAASVAKPVDTTITASVGLSGDTHITLLDADILVTSEGRFGSFSTGDCAINPVDNYNVFCGYFKSDSLVFETYQGTTANGTQFKFEGVKK